MNDFAVSGSRRKNFSEFPLAWLACSFAVGIFAARLFAQPIFVWLTATFVCLAATVFYRRRARFAASTVCALFAFFSAGALLGAIETNDFAANRVAKVYDAGKINFKTPIKIAGTLQNEPEETVGGRFLLLETAAIDCGAGDETASGAIRLFVPFKDESERKAFEQLDLHYNTKIRAVAEITREDRFRNPGYHPFREYLSNKNLDAIGAIKSPAAIQNLGEGNGFALFKSLYRWRASLIGKFKQRFSLPTAGVLAASLLNNRYFLDKQSSESFRAGGTFHVLVISGAHITFIGLLFAGVVGVFTKNRWLQFATANVLLWAFAVAVGAETPIVRAALMFTIVYAGALSNRTSSPLNALGAATLILLVVKPSNLFDSSFQLTLLSVAAIVGAAFPILAKMREIGAWRLSANSPIPPNCSRRFKTLCETLFWNELAWTRQQQRQIWRARLFKSDLAKRIGKNFLQAVWRFVFVSISVSIVVTLWLLPPSVVYFHRFSFAGIFLNVFVGALIAIETFSGIFAVLVAEISRTLAQPFVFWTETLNFLLTNSAAPFVRLKAASVRLPVYGGARGAIYSIYYLPLVALAIWAHRWNPFQLAVSNQRLTQRKLFKIFLLIAHCSLLAAILLHPFSAADTNNRLRVDFLDVGQGDAALITTPGGATILVDGGGKPDFRLSATNENGALERFEPDSQSIGEAVVSEFLWENGLSRVDFLVSTHADADHIDGLNDAARNFAVQTAFVARTPAKNANFAEFSRTLENERIPLQKINRGAAFEIDNVKIEVLSPLASADEQAASDNDSSIVFRLTYKNRKFLFTGDIEAKTERFLLDAGDDLKVDVVKVAHHGSATSSIENFVRATNAKYAVISVGRDSPYNHPKPEIVARWQNAGAQTLTTGENGAITFTTDGEDLTLETFVKN